MSVVPPGSREPVAPPPATLPEPVESPLHQPPADAWSRLVPETEKGFYDTRSWHLAHADLTGASASVLVAGDPAAPEPVPRAILPVYRYPGAPANPAFDPARLFPDGGLDPAAWGPITLLGTTVGYETVPLCRDADEAWWARAAEVIAAGRNGTVACLYLDEPDAVRLAAHLPDAHVLLCQARTALPILGRTVAEHQATLTVKQRWKARKEPDRVRQAGRQASWRPLRPEDVPTYAALQVSTQVKHGAGGSTEWFAAQLHRYLADPQLQQAAVVFLVEDDGGPVGFTLAFRHADALVLRLCGLDYDRAIVGEYFSLMVYEPVRYCTEHGLSRIDFGLASYRQKLVRGARLIPQYTLLLGPPPEWTAEHTRRHNTAAALGMLQETEGLLTEPDSARLRRLAGTGRVGE